MQLNSALRGFSPRGVRTAMRAPKLGHGVLAVGSRTFLVSRPVCSLTATCETKLGHGVFATGGGTLLVYQAGVLTATCEMKLFHGALAFG